MVARENRSTGLHDPLHETQPGRAFCGCPVVVTLASVCAALYVLGIAGVFAAIELSGEASDWSTTDQVIVALMWPFVSLALLVLVAFYKYDNWRWRL